MNATIGRRNREQVNRSRPGRYTLMSVPRDDDAEWFVFDRQTGKGVAAFTDHAAAAAECRRRNSIG